MRCFCAQAQKQVDKSEIYLAISIFILQTLNSPLILQIIFAWIQYSLFVFTIEFMSKTT